MVAVGEDDDAAEVSLAVGVGIGVGVGGSGADMVQSSFRCVVNMLSVFVVLWHLEGVEILMCLLIEVCM